MYVALYSGYIGHNLNIISLIVMTVGVISIVKNEYCNITFEIFLAQTWIYPPPPDGNVLYYNYALPNL